MKNLKIKKYEKEKKWKMKEIGEIRKKRSMKKKWKNKK